MKKLILVLTLIAVSSVFTFGQDDYKKGEFFVGFSHNQVDLNNFSQPMSVLDDPIVSRHGYNGFNVSGVYNVSRYVGVKGDFSGTYNSASYTAAIPGGAGTISYDADSSLYNVLGGVQVKDNSSEAKVKPFAHALVGAGFNKIDKSNIDVVRTGPFFAPIIINDLDVSETGLAGAFGGGIDIKLSKRVDLRAIQVDYNPVRFNNGTQNNFRFGIGLVFK